MVFQWSLQGHEVTTALCFKVQPSHIDHIEQDRNLNGKLLTVDCKSVHASSILLLLLQIPPL